ncbi:EspA/EspE family type VII secretion system effector [Mycolicibacterium brisbanense]
MAPRIPNHPGGHHPNPGGHHPNPGGHHPRNPGGHQPNSSEHHPHPGGQHPHNPGGHHPSTPGGHHPHNPAGHHPNDEGGHGGGIFSKIKNAFDDAKDIVSDIKDIVSDVKDITDTVSDVASDVKDIFSGTFGGLASGLGNLIDIGRQFFSNAPETPIIDAGLKVINGMSDMCGDGSPDTGEGFAGGADQLDNVGQSLDSAAPDDSWEGGGASAYSKQNVKQQGRMQTLAETDNTVAQVLAQEAEQLGVTVQQLNGAATILQLAILPASIAMADPLGGEAVSVAIQIAAVASGMAIATPAMANMVSNSMQNAQAIQQAANSYRDVASNAKLDGSPSFSPSTRGNRRPHQKDPNGKPESQTPPWLNQTPLGDNATPGSGESMYPGGGGTGSGGGSGGTGTGGGGGGTASGGGGGNPAAGTGGSGTGGAPVSQGSGAATPAGMSTGSSGGVPGGLPGGGASGGGSPSGLLSGLGSALGSLIGQAAQQGAQAAQNAQNQKAQEPGPGEKDGAKDKDGKDLEKDAKDEDGDKAEGDADKDGKPDVKPEDAQPAGAQAGPGAPGERAPIHFEFDMDREQVHGPVNVTLDPDHPNAAPVVSRPPTQQV